MPTCAGIGGIVSPRNGPSKRLDRSPGTAIDRARRRTADHIGTQPLQENKMATAALEYYQSNQERFLAGLTDLLKIPSISTLPEHRSDVRRACESLADELRAMGMQQVDIIEGKANQNPLVYAEWKGAPAKPTLLLYGH